MGGGFLSRGEKIPKSDEGFSRISGPKYTPVENFNPHISPKWGAIHPNKICFYQGPQAYNAQWPVRGVGGVKSLLDV